MARAEWSKHFFSFCSSKHVTAFTNRSTEQNDQQLRVRVSTADLRGWFPQQIPDRSLHRHYRNPGLPRLPYISLLLQWQSFRSLCQRRSVFRLPLGPHDRYHNRSFFPYPAACLIGRIWLKRRAQRLRKAPTTRKISQDTKQTPSYMASLSS